MIADSNKGKLTKHAQRCHLNSSAKNAKWNGRPRQQKTRTLLHNSPNRSELVRHRNRNTATPVSQCGVNPGTSNRFICYRTCDDKTYIVIPRLTKTIRSGITFVSRNVIVTHIQTEKISSWNGPTVHVCCFMLARASTKTFVSRIHIR